MSEEEREVFEKLVLKELDACGYFISGRGSKYPMDKMIMDFACLYCMENFNKNYKYFEEKENGK